MFPKDKTHEICMLTEGGRDTGVKLNCICRAAEPISDRGMTREEIPSEMKAEKSTNMEATPNDQCCIDHPGE